MRINQLSPHGRCFNLTDGFTAGGTENRGGQAGHATQSQSCLGKP